MKTRRKKSKTLRLQIMLVIYKKNNMRRQIKKHFSRKIFQQTYISITKQRVLNIYEPIHIVLVLLNRCFHVMCCYILMESTTYYTIGALNTFTQKPQLVTAFLSHRIMSNIFHPTPHKFTA